MEKNFFLTDWKMAFIPMALQSMHPGDYFFTDEYDLALNEDTCISLLPCLTSSLFNVFVCNLGLFENKISVRMKSILFQ